MTGRLALVTGADGFIGSHLTEALLAHGYRVRALAQYNSFNNWGWLEDVGSRLPDWKWCAAMCATPSSAVRYAVESTPCFILRR